MSLDHDKNSMLSKQELSQYKWGLTNLFVDRVFEENATYSGEMDFKSFVELVLAFENRKTAQSLTYFWRVLNVYGKPAIDSFVINMFFKAVSEKLDSQDKGGYKVEDIIDEIFDIAKPKTPQALTLRDLIDCKSGHIIVTMLIDAKGFYDYDQRESGNILDAVHDDDSSF